VSMEIQKLLDDFAMIVVDDMPMGMPPMRSIMYQINLIQTSNLPNKDPYRMTFVEGEEVKREVKELLNNGLIQESLSHCAILEILTPKKGGEW
jgi:hypothetical protein